MPGELQGDAVLVRAQSEANRIFNKGRYGRPLSGGALKLDLVEAIYLVESGRLEVHNGDVALGWTQLLAEAQRRDPASGVRFLVYRDLRERGLPAEPAGAAEADVGADFVVPESDKPGTVRPRTWVRAASERAEFAWADVFRFAEAATRQHVVPRLAIVDEESDLTHYELGIQAPKGRRPPGQLPVSSADLVADRVLVPDERTAKVLHDREFLGRPVAKTLQLSWVEALHLVGRNCLEVRDAATGRAVSAAALLKRARATEPELDLRLRVYADLRARGLVAKTGFKFGTHFRAYEGEPDEAHAPYLVQAVGRDYRSAWEPLARAVRLSHSVRKRFYLAAPSTDSVEFLSFGRLK